MTIGGHIAEIARQGIWASLTGGWYYEPAHSAICNVAHLYLWIILFLSPLLFGLLYKKESSHIFIGCYVAFIAIIFFLLKMVVLYLHNLFDTTDPILSSDRDSSNNAQSEGLGQSTDIKQNTESEIEMVDLRPIKSQEALDGTEESSAFDPVHHRRRTVRIDDLMGHVVQGSSHQTSKPDFDDWPDGSGVVLFNNKQKGERYTGGERMTVLLPADSFEMLPIEARKRSDLDGLPRSAIVRKYSEPCLEDSFQWKRTTVRRMSDTDPCVRRAKSAFETTNRSTATSGTMLSQRTLEECKKSTRKSYPSKMSSTAAFLSSTFTKRPSSPYFESDSLDAVGTLRSSNLKEQQETSLASVSRPDNEITFDGSLKVLESESEEIDREIAEINERVERSPTVVTEAENSRVVAGSSGHAWSHVFVSVGDSDRPSTSGLNRTTDRLIGSDSLQILGAASDRIDLKGEITKFLEDLIDKHPETLDAIESVRMNRLGRSSNTFNVSTFPPRPMSSNQMKLMERGPVLASALSNIASRDGTHIAVDHEDTSEGALHSFQDEDGNWWTYAFNTQGGGTAQALGSSRALMEIIHSGNAAPQHSKLVALPESDSDSSGELGMEKPGDSNRKKSSKLNEQRPRALSSSSVESGTYIADLPTTIFHASNTANSSRFFDRDRHMTTFANVAARFRDATRRRSQGTAILGDVFLEEQSDTVNLDSYVQLRADRASRESNTSQSMNVGRVSFSSVHRISFFSDLTTIGTAVGDTRRTSVRKNQYYRLKMFPSASKGGIKLKCDRLSVAAFLDRNRSLFSSLFDVVLAAFIAFLAGMLLSKEIFYDLSLILFAIVVAGAQYSLLKSVQPDASSPIHGFNWLVAYSRPIFFCLLGSALLIADSGWWHFRADNPSIGWHWNPYRLNAIDYSSIIAAFRDFFGLCLILSPFAFTIGLIPQTNTLLLHILEQIEIHIFGGTACFSLLSAVVQLLKSISVVSILAFLANLAYKSDPKNTQNIFFSIFVAFSVSLSWLLSRTLLETSAVLQSESKVSKIKHEYSTTLLVRCVSHQLRGSAFPLGGSTLTTDHAYINLPKCLIVFGVDL